MFYYSTCNPLETALAAPAVVPTLSGVQKPWKLELNGLLETRFIGKSNPTSHPRTLLPVVQFWCKLSVHTLHPSFGTGETSVHFYPREQALFLWRKYSVEYTNFSTTTPSLCLIQYTYIVHYHLDEPSNWNWMFCWRNKPSTLRGSVFPTIYSAFMKYRNQGLCLWAPYDPQNKQPLFPHTALNDWLQYVVFSLPYELHFEILFAW